MILLVARAVLEGVLPDPPRSGVLELLSQISAVEEDVDAVGVGLFQSVVVRVLGPGQVRMHWSALVEVVVASHTGHEFLRVAGFHVCHELVSGGATKRCRPWTVVTDHHLVAHEVVLESAWSLALGPSMPLVAQERHRVQSPILMPVTLP